MEARLRIGCLGAARIAPPALVHPARVHGAVQLSAVAARDPARAREFADLHGLAQVRDGYEALVDDPEVDIVYNPLPINLHAEWTIRALDAGKHVLCEKPLAMNAGEVEAMLEAAKRNGRRLIEAFHYRYHPAFETYLAWLGAERIGRLRRIEAHFCAPIDDDDGREIRHLPETGGGAFMDLGCYPLSWTLMSTAEEPVSVDAEAELTPRGVDERLIATLRFADGLEATLEASMAMSETRRMGLRVVGDDGEIRFDNPLAPQLGSTLTIDCGGETESAAINRVSTYFYQLDAVVRALQTGEALPTEGNALLRQQRLLDRIYAAAGLAGLRNNAQ